MSTAWLGAAIELALPYKLYPCCCRNYGLMVSLWIPHGPDPLVGNNENKSAPLLHINLNCARGYTQKKPPARQRAHARLWCVYVETQARIRASRCMWAMQGLTRALPVYRSAFLPAFLACLHNVCRLMCKISNHVPDFYSFILIFFLFILPLLCTL